MNSEPAPSAPPDAARPTRAFADDWQEWHRRHEEARADRHGFLAVAGLHWLTAEPQRFPGVPGEWRTGTDGPVVTLADDEEIVVDGRRIRKRHQFGVIAERAGITVEIDGGVLEVARRGGRDILRPRRPDHPLRTRYGGTATFPPAERWVLQGRFVPFERPRPTTVGAAVEGLQHIYDAPGRIEFCVDGLPLSLTAFNGVTPGSLSVSLAVGTPDEQGRVTLDFNRAVNLPCAYTDFATCPLPPTENRLPVAVEAGEKIPYERLAADAAARS
ncbi:MULTISPECIES: DUF1684 domain-containing protein [unclassified Micromonospora]|uniref:DUF1684 domain-containing protein n=1 Tax=unclassified Micromonospora TaxID=2617518 RepID=UPI0003EECA2C|nr:MULTISPECIES: DUF1684 domain-containing protein [unclassified Micromonospora]EWM64324.1 hypothetical protein MCBG_01457 [Micromonospora sp. M42]MCK1805260.1 DUF1684 domain-containing protein [Micromonospora sp. R42106]MCK1834060.1 DUF1684 domain-containing protein [Micromonospora sp. R42003]MCK1842072.1 DUF1684 domain-containing protein [Micromonospora sp. R42004]MCM1015330.1 DUF1684 domain-containing protein [Micromonospora sp. XM-20-01]